MTGHLGPLRGLLVATILAVSFSAPSAGPPTLRSELIADGLDEPMFVTAPAGDPRLFVVERAGRVRIVDGGSVLVTPFLDISAVVSSDGAFGMFGMAFDPDFATTATFYVYYVNLAGESTISRFQVSPDPNVALAASGEVVFSLAQPFLDHNGGTIAFGPQDGFLYFAPGDGGGGPYDPDETSQDPSRLLGKMLRLDVGGGPGTVASAPRTNPFTGDAGVLDEIWAFGLRNPFRFSFDRLTGDRWFADVGQENREEVNFEQAADPGGHNYGWDVMEGTLCVADVGWDPSDAFVCNDPVLKLPLYEYDHDAGDCSITGGYVYRGSIPEIHGLYFFGDYCTGRISTLESPSLNVIDWTAELEPPGSPSIGAIVGFGEDGYGELYVVDRDGEVFRVRSAAPDGDDDVVPDSVDNCPGTANPDQLDTDADTIGDACDDDDDNDTVLDGDDCAPLDDTLWAVPGEVTGLTVSRIGVADPAAVLDWDPPATPGGTLPAYDTLVSSDPGDFSALSASCVESGDGADTQSVDPVLPAAGSARHFLVRATNPCGVGTLGMSSSGARDGGPCP